MKSGEDKTKQNYITVINIQNTGLLVGKVNALIMKNTKELSEMMSLQILVAGMYICQSSSCMLKIYIFIECKLNVNKVSLV